MIRPMKPRFFCLFGLLLCLGGTAQAQVFKCVGADGRTVYADAPCGSGAKELARDQLEANTLDAAALRDRARADRETAPPGQAAAGAASANGVASVCPPPQDIRNLETSASSSGLGDAEREFLWAEIRRARACSREGSRYTAEDWRVLREAQGAQTSGNPVEREAARRRAEAVHASAASAQEQRRMQTDRQVQAQRESGTTVIVRPPAWRPPVPQPRPQDQLDCRGTVCTDASGGRYDRQPDGQLTRRQDQANCTEVRGQLRCSGGFGR